VMKPSAKWLCALRVIFTKLLIVKDFIKI